MVTRLTTIALLYYHSEDCRITGRNMLINILQINKIHHKVKVHCLVVYMLYIIYVLFF